MRRLTPALIILLVWVVTAFLIVYQLDLKGWPAVILWVIASTLWSLWISGIPRKRV